MWHTSLPVQQNIIPEKEAHSVNRGYISPTVLYIIFYCWQKKLKNVLIRDERIKLFCHKTASLKMERKVKSQLPQMFLNCA